MKIVFLLGASVILAAATGCTTMRGMTSDPTIVQASADSVTYRAAEGLRDEAKSGAENHCQNRESTLNSKVSYPARTPREHSPIAASDQTQRRRIIEAAS